MTTPRNHEPEMVILTDVQESTAPPSSPVLMVSVIDDEVFLSVATMTEDHKETKFTRVANVCVYLPALLRAIVPVDQGFTTWKTPTGG